MDEDPELGIEGLEMLDELDAVLAVELDLEDQQIGEILAHLLHPLLGGGAGPGDLPMALFLQEMRNADPRGGLAVDDRDPGLRGGL